MTWKKEIKKYDVKSEIERALRIVSKLRKEYNIKTEHTEGLDELLLGLLRNEEKLQSVGKLFSKMKMK